MADDQQRLARFLDGWERDQRDGVTIRAVHNRVSGLQNRFEDHSRETRDRLTKLETKAEAIERTRSADELAAAIAEGTGRHQIPVALTTPVQPFPVQPFTPAFGTVVPAEVRAPEKKHSGFWKSAKTAALRHGGTAAGAAVITLLVSWLAGRGCVPAQAVEKIEAPAASGR